jgi:DNA-binding CsgD family transcriptional regulator
MRRDGAWERHVKASAPLTQMESRVLEMRAAGASYPEVASATGGTINQVLAAIGRAVMKLDVATERDAIRCYTGEYLERALHAEHERRFGASLAA